MKPILGIAGLFLLAAAVAQADIPPPKGLRRVPLDHKIEIAKQYPDWAFYSRVGGKGPRSRVTKLTLDPKTPAIIPGAGRAGIGRLCVLVAVPAETVKQYANEKDLIAAIQNDKAEGMLVSTARFDSSSTVKDGDKRTSVVETYRIEKVDARDGIEVKRVTEEGAPTSAPPKRGTVPPGEDSPSAAYSPRGGAWIAGFAAFAAIALAGLWFARRTR